MITKTSLKVALTQALLTQFAPFFLFATPAAGQSGPNAGQVLFTQYCSVCHGATGEGGSGPDLTNPSWQHSMMDDQLGRTIRDGRPGTAMPSFKDRIDANGRLALVAYLRHLSASAIQPANSLLVPEIKVSKEVLEAPDREPDQWLMYGRDPGNRHFSPLNEITRTNIGNLVPAWSFQTGTPDGLEAVPLFVNGILYLTTAWDHVFAIDALSGAEVWHYRRRLPEKLRYCCGPVNRGVAILGDTLYLGTLDAHLVALSARDGRVRWDVQVGKIDDNNSITAAPLVAGNKILTGVGGGDYRSRGYLDAYNATTGKRIWRFYTVPESKAGKGPWSGGATWMNGSFDPALNLIYWGTGNPYPDYDGDIRKGPNLYSDSVLALDADSGKLVWSYQFTPHDVWDYDGVNEMVFVDSFPALHGRVNALLHADRNGYLFALDRASGAFLYAKPFVHTTWATGFDAAGTPVINPQAITSYKGVRVCPGAAGGKEWNAMAYSPMTRMVYVPAIENCAMFYNYGSEAKKKGMPPGPSGFRYLPGQAFGKVMAIYADTGERAWELKTRTPMGAGMLATAGNVVFTGTAEGAFQAFDAEKGTLLWSYQTGSGIRAAPISYRLDGHQYIAIASGMGGAVGGFTGAGAPWMRNYRSGGTLYVFRLFDSSLFTTARAHIK